MSKRKIIITFVLLSVIIVCYGCKSDDSNESKIKGIALEIPQIEESQLPNEELLVPSEEPSMPSDEELYGSIMDLYYQEFSTVGNLYNVCESDMADGTYLSLDDVGYTFTDLNNDGTNELLTFITEFGDLLAIYSYADGQVKQVAVSNSRDYYYICENNIIANEGSSGASNSVTNYFRLSEQGALQLVEYVMYDDSISAYDTYFHCTDGVHDNPISQSEANIIRSQYKQATVDYKTLRNYKSNATSYVQTSTPVKVINYSGYSVEAIFPKEPGSYMKGNSIVSEMVPSGYTGTGTFHYTTNVTYDLMITVMDVEQRTDVVKWTVSNVNSSQFSSEGVTLVILSDETLIYNTADYVLPGTEYYQVTSGILDDLTPEQLRIARNEIYAKHGKIFDDSQLQAYFESKSWYQGTVPSEEFSDSVLSEQEKRNAELILSFENGEGIGL